MKQFPLPPGVGWKYGRSVEDSDDTAQTMQTNILLAVALIFLVMASLFESLLYPDLDPHLDRVCDRRRVLGACRSRRRRCRSWRCSGS